MLYRKLGLLAAAIALGVGIAGVAKAEDKPTPDAIIAKYVKATGGEDAWKGVKSRSSKGKLTVVAMGMNGTMTQYVQGNNAKSIMSLEGFGEFLSGMKDGKMWSSNMMQGDTLLEGAEADAAKQQFDVQQWLHWKDYYSGAETVGEEAVGDKTCWKVTLTPKAGEPVTNWYDKESGLLLQSVGPGMGGGPATTTFKDYKAAGPLTMPYTMSIEGANGPVEITFESIEVNKDIDAANFEVPAGIAALLNPGAAPAAAPAK